MQIKKNNLILIIVPALIAAVLSFYAGTIYQKGKSANLTANQPGAPAGQMAGRPDSANSAGQQKRTGQGNGFQPVSGEIVSLEDNTLTIKASDGSSKIVVFSDSTVINTTTTGSKTDLASGANVMVIGTTNSDGSVTAKTLNVGQEAMTPPGNQPATDGQAPEQP